MMSTAPPHGAAISRSTNKSTTSTQQTAEGWLRVCNWQGRPVSCHLWSGVGPLALPGHNCPCLVSHLGFCFGFPMELLSPRRGDART